MTASDSASASAPFANDALAQQFQGLTAQSLALLEDVLADETVPKLERAKIAAKILEVAGIQGRSPHPPAFQPPAFQPKAPSSDSPLTVQNLDSGVDNSLTSTDPLGGEAETAYVSLLPPRFIQLDNFLSPEENQKALQTALENREKFVESSTTTNANNYRQSSVLYATHYADLYHLLRKRLLKLMPDIMRQLDSTPFLVSQVEMQMTAHGDGCFYKIHNDSGSPETETRVLSYVYYFHQEPKAYSGGGLRVYETDLYGPATDPSDLFEDFIPTNNSIVLFDSRIKHEVLPVTCPSRKFEDSRFTLNGWLRRV